MMIITKMAALGCCLFLGFIPLTLGITSDITFRHIDDIHLNEHGGKTIELRCYVKTEKVEIKAIKIYNELDYLLAFVEKGEKCENFSANVNCTSEISQKNGHLSMYYIDSDKSNMCTFYCSYSYKKTGDLVNISTEVIIKEKEKCNNPGSGKDTSDTWGIWISVFTPFAAAGIVLYYGKCRLNNMNKDMEDEFTDTREHIIKNMTEVMESKCREIKDKMEQMSTISTTTDSRGEHRLDQYRSGNRRTNIRYE